MSVGPDSLDRARAWLSKAAADLASARALLEAETPAWVAAFHAQQCVEKCLKALLVAWQRPFPKSHDVGGLLLLLPAELGLTIDRRLAAELTESAIAGRYPGTEDPGAAVARDLVSEAQRVFDWTGAYLQSQ